MRIAIAVLAALCADAAADPAPAAAPIPAGPSGPITGFEVRGPSKVQPQVLGYLTHLEIGHPVGPDELATIEEALMSSELFEHAQVTLEPAPGDPSPGVVVVATVVDKHSWIVAPAAFALPGNLAAGVGYAENDFRGLDQKILLYGQVGTHTSLFFGTFLDPAVRGSRLTWRADLYAYQRDVDEYINPPGDPGSTQLGRVTTSTYFSAAGLIGWNFRWWLGADLRLRAGYVYFRDSQDGMGKPLPSPEKDGWDVSVQARLTLDHRHHLRGVTWGPYLQLHLEPSVPGLDQYGYQLALVRAYHSWRLFGEHELELRGILNAGRHLPLHDDLTIGGATDLRGYSVDQFRGDTRAVFRAEYSVPVYQWQRLAFRALGFYDAGYEALNRPRGDDRIYLPNELADRYTRSDVGAGLRIYLRNIVLPLVGLDVAYGIESGAPELYFEVGLTDF